MVVIYGKAGCPHTKRALDAHPGARFIDVLMSPADLEKMMELSGGLRKVPVIVEDGKVSIGFNRGS